MINTHCNIRTSANWSIENLGESTGNEFHSIYTSLKTMKYLFI